MISEYKDGDNKPLEVVTHTVEPAPLPRHHPLRRAIARRVEDAMIHKVLDEIYECTHSFGIKGGFGECSACEVKCGRT